jgi:hypothetical protein
MTRRLRELAARLGSTADEELRPAGRSDLGLLLPALIVVFVAAGIGWSSVSAGAETKQVLSKGELKQFLANDEVRNERAFCTAVAGKGSPRCPDPSASRAGSAHFSVTGACLFALEDYEKWFGRTILEDGWQDFPRWREAARQVREQCGPAPERTWGNLLTQ